MPILEIAAGIVLGALILALIPVMLGFLAEGWSLFWEFVAALFVFVFFTIPRAILRIARVLATLVMGLYPAI